MTHFVQSIGDYKSPITHDTVYSKAARKYLLKALYEQTNKKKYKL